MYIGEVMLQSRAQYHQSINSLNHLVAPKDATPVYVAEQFYCYLAPQPQLVEASFNLEHVEARTSARTEAKYNA